MSAMGERFLMLEETADALDVFDPELATHFRMVNGLPRWSRDERPVGSDPTDLELPATPFGHHEIWMDVGDTHIRSVCSCGEWSDSVGWDEIDTMVVHVREHVGPGRASSGDGIAEADSSESGPGAGTRVG